MTERLTSKITQIISQMFSSSQVSKEASISTSAVCAAPHMDMAKRVCQPDNPFGTKGFSKLIFQASLKYTHFLADPKHIPEHTDPLRFLHWGSQSTG